MIPFLALVQVIRRPKVECQVHKDSFELDITSNDDVQSIKQKVEGKHVCSVEGERMLESTA